MENEQKKFLKLNDIEAYKIAFNLSNYIWDIVITWDIFAKKTIEEQYVDAVDSISANIAEGFGRYSKKDKIRFYRISFGSVFESLDWNQKSIVKNLLTKDHNNYIFNELQKLPKSINSLISFTNNKLQI
ncbi:MAG: four helix bundle protein [Ignavibacteriae bacterium]|nr:four helix bundle protein [Ignavibacteriota bacterium]